MDDGVLRLRFDCLRIVSLWSRNLSGEEYTANGEFVNGLVYTNALFRAPDLRCQRELPVLNR